MRNVSMLRSLGLTTVAAIILLFFRIVQAAPPTARQQIDELLKLVEEKYVGALPTDSLVAVVRESILKTLDPYSQYLNEQDYVYLKRDIEGSFGGIGIMIRVDSTLSMIRIKAPFLNSPALKAGIRPGDLLVAVDGTSLIGGNIDDAAGALIGKVGTPVSVTIRRDGQAGDMTLAMERAKIAGPTVRGFRHPSAGRGEYLIDESARIGYIRISGFSKTTPQEFGRAVKAAESAGATSLVLDLRLSSGGLMNAAIDVADQLLDQGTIVTLRDRDEEEVRKATPGVTTELPIALLIDEATASSSEIFAAAVADNHRVTVIGATHSYGKGHGQELFPLKKGAGALKLTTFSYHRPSGAPMERHFGVVDSMTGGIWPDSGLTVPLSDTERQHWEDAMWELDGRMQFTNDYVATLPPVSTSDPVLERAIAFLQSNPHH